MGNLNTFQMYIPLSSKYQEVIITLQYESDNSTCLLKNAEVDNVHFEQPQLFSNHNSGPIKQNYLTFKMLEVVCLIHHMMTVM